MSNTKSEPSGKLWTLGGDDVSLRVHLLSQRNSVGKEADGEGGGDGATEGLWKLYTLCLILLRT